MTDASPSPMPWRASAALGLVLFAVALWACPRHVQPGDAGELATVMLEGGVPHPSGYPWMRALGLFARALAGIGVPPMLAAALPCALLAIAGWIWIARAVARLVAWPAAIVAVGFVALAHGVVVHTCDVEVWGPLVLAIAAMLHLAIVPPRQAWRAGVVFGLCLAHHLTCVWLLPLAIAAGWPRSSPTRAAILRAALAGVLGTLLGLGFYATLAIGDGDAWRWGDTRSLEGLLHHVLRRDYGVLSLSLHDASPSTMDQLARVGSAWTRMLTAGLLEHAIVAPLLLAAIAYAAVRAWPRTQREAGVAIASAWLSAALVFPLMHDIDPRSPFAAWILERFDVMPFVLLAPALALALHRAWLRVPSGWPRTLAVLTVAVLGLRQLGTTWERGVPSDDDLVEAYAVNVLRTPDPDRPALVLGTDDHRSFGVLYAHEVLGEGAQVLYVDASLLAHPWYRARLRRRWPDLPDVDKPVALLRALWDRGSDVPVYLANEFSVPSTSLPRVPEGVLWRVLSPAEIDVGPELVQARHLAARARLRSATGVSASPFSSDLAAAAAEPTLRLDQGLRRAGRPDLAAELPAPP
ncbi:MAG TPA: hypothetical protein VG755_04185 [Nannocystaceae bacterium]|nr:hypothetical protein [Nannocystaceae bacterium]